MCPVRVCACVCVCVRVRVCVWCVHDHTASVMPIICFPALPATSSMCSQRNALLSHLVSCSQKLTIHRNTHTHTHTHMPGYLPNPWAKLPEKTGSLQRDRRGAGKRKTTRELPAREPYWLTLCVQVWSPGLTVSFLCTGSRTWSRSSCAPSTHDEERHDWVHHPVSAFYGQHSGGWGGISKFKVILHTNCLKVKQQNSKPGSLFVGLVSGNGY
jgi:hypothetical protein